MACVAGAALAVVAWSSPCAVAAQQFGKITREVRFEQKLDAQVPLDLVFQDSTGRDVRVGELLGQRPVILALVYYDCPMLCTQVLNGLSASLRQLDSLSIGDDYEVLTVSIDPAETPALSAQKKAAYTAALGAPGAERGWHFLTGAQPAIDALCDAVGFRYFYDEEVGEYAHAGGVVILTPGGKVSRYFIDVVFPKLDLRLALVESSEGRIGSLIDAITLLCYRHDPTTGKYGLVVTNVIRLGGGLTVGLLLCFIVLMLRRDRALARAAAQPAGST
ncbi:MAG: SCO family protein [Planctomycetes bacterium]|nr:SCO family protein [Planctomycetota bacterium]